MTASRVDVHVEPGPKPPKAQTPATPEATADAELVAALRRRDPRAFDAVYARYRVRIYSFLVRLAGRRDLADDLFQETFMQLARHAQRLAPDTELGAFLYTVARNRYLNHRRMSMFRLGRLREIFAGREAGSPSLPAAVDLPTAPTPYEQAAASDTARRLERALQALSPTLREAVLLVSVEGLEPDAAARILSIEPAALRQRLSRARAQLAEQLRGGSDGA